MTNDVLIKMRCQDSSGFRVARLMTEARNDIGRLNATIAGRWYVYTSRRGARSEWCVKKQGHARPLSTCHDTARAAIDAAIDAERP
jgi:hypothetical protein